jgi:SpoVK/Ycf46/Vps4 family AAA+-type ATPase
VKYCEDKLFIIATINTFALFAICSKAMVDCEGFDFSYMDLYIQFGRREINQLRMKILNGEWEPIQDKLVEIDGGNQIEHNPTLRLTSSGYSKLLKELDSDLMQLIRSKSGLIKTPMIQPQQIQKIKLVFSDEFTENTNRITQLLTQKSFVKYQSSFPKNAKMKGMTLLFHGGPGCGKTEFAMQLSKQTGRPLMKIQVTDFQSKWVGQSESQLKAIFDDYRMSFDRMKIKPILFLNECDQIIGKRISVGNSVDQMSNALQNILLEEMENFDGIMIGTTNLKENMDSAFERRWIIKLQFDTPNSEAQKAIWKSYIKGLKPIELDQLVNQFHFTPGEIANIARRFKVEQLLGLRSTKFQTLLSLSETERFIKTNPTNKAIGFDLRRQAS